MLIYLGIELWHSDFKYDIGLEGLVSRNDFSACGLIGLISNRSIQTSSGLNEESAAVFLSDSLDSVWSNSNSFLVFVDFFGDTDGYFFGINTEKVLG